MPTITLMANPLNEPALARELLPAGFELLVADPETPAFLAAAQRSEFVVGYSRPMINAGFFQAAPSVRLVQLLSAGYDQSDIAAHRAAGVPLCNNGGANATAVAEHAIMLMLAVCRRLPWLHASTAAGRWRGNDVANTRLYELRGKTLGIIGLGTIGKKVARLANAFGMNVQYYDIRRVPEETEDALQLRFRLLRELLRSSDIVSLHTPLLPSTRHLLGRAEIALMKPEAYLINTSRGPVVDEAALTEALTAGRLAGAGLDVFDQEPPPADNPLLALPNVVLTPHYAGPTWDNQVARFRNAFDNCQRVARGEKPLWVIPELA
jgi:phosphoglycerate dehydrogenase-like enzyme